MELLMVAGEASGDLHGARLMTALRQQRPELSFFGLGGDEMRAAGLDGLAHSREIAVVGITEALRVLRRARQLLRSLRHEARRRRPQAAILIDAPDFNLRLAKALKPLGIPVVYYISPQVWAWRRGRVKSIGDRVARMLVLFPFEAAFYEARGVEVVHVGHPLVDEVPELGSIWETPPAADDRRRRLALLPGSRDSELELLLPVMLESAARLAARYDLAISLIQAPTVSAETMERLVRQASIEVEIVRRDRFRVVADSHLALCASGTATLEVGLLGTPMIVLYRVGRWTACLARLLVDVPNIALVNLVLERGVVPELLQTDANANNVVESALPLLAGGETVAHMRQALSEVRPRLGEGGASERAAHEVVALLEENERSAASGGGGG